MKFVTAIALAAANEANDGTGAAQGSGGTQWLYEPKTKGWWWDGNGYSSISNANGGCTNNDQFTTQGTSATNCAALCDANAHDCVGFWSYANGRCCLKNGLGDENGIQNWHKRRGIDLAGWMWGRYPTRYVERSVGFWWQGPSYSSLDPTVPCNFDDTTTSLAASRDQCAERCDDNNDGCVGFWAYDTGRCCLKDGVGKESDGQRNPHTHVPGAMYEREGYALDTVGFWWAGPGYSSLDPTVPCDFDNSVDSQAESAPQCARHCDETAGCVGFWAYDTGRCCLKDGLGSAANNQRNVHAYVPGSMYRLVTATQTVGQQSAADAAGPMQEATVTDATVDAMIEEAISYGDSVPGQ